MAASELKIAGMKLMIEGGAQFQSDLNTAKTTSKMLTSELKLLEAGTTSAGKNGIEFLRAKSESLSAQLAKQEQVTKINKIALQEAANATEVDAKQVQRLENEVLKSQIAEEKLKVSLVGVTEQMNKATDSALQHGIAQKKMGEDIEKAGKNISGVGDNMTKYLTVPALAAATALAALVVKTVEVADGIKKQAEITGLSTDRIQELTYAGKDLDVELEVITKSMAKNIKSMKGAQDGTELTVEAYKKLGVEYKNTDGSLKDSEEVYWQVIESLGSMTNETERDAIAMQLLGKSAMELNPLIKAGSDKLAELSEEAHKNGAVMSGEGIDSLDAFGDAVEKAKVSIGTAAGEITVKMMPTLEKLLPIVQKDIVPAIGQFAEFVGDLIVGFTDMDPVAQGVVATLAGLALVAGPLLEITGTGITLAGSITTARALQTIATQSLSGAEVVATGTGLTMAATLGPILLVIAAVAGASIGYMKLTEDTRAVMAASREALKEAEDLAAACEDSATAFSKQTGEAETNAVVMQKLSDKLYVLSGKENKSNAEKAQMVSLVSQLNDQMPDLNLTIDKQTGALNKNKTAVDNLIQSKLDEIKLQASEDRLLELYKENIKLTDAMTTAQKTLTDAKAKDETNKHMYSDDWDAIMNAKKAVDLLTISYDENAAMAKAQEDAIGQNGDTITSYADTFYDSANKIIDANKETVTAAKMTAEESAAALKQYEDAYSEYRTNIESDMKENLSAMGSVEDERIEQTKSTAAKIKANLEQQILDYSNWHTNIKGLASRVAPDVLTELENLGPGYATVLAELNGMTDEELNAWIATWVAKGNLAEQAAQDTSDRINGTWVGMHSIFYGLGVDAINGLIEGMNSKGAAATAQAQRDAARIEQTYRKTLDSRSPSRKMMEVGKDAIDGVIIGMKNKGDLLAKETDISANRILSGFDISPAISLGGIATNRAMANYGSSSSSVVNTSTTNAPVINVSVNNPNVRSQDDIDGITRGIALKVTDAMKAVGAI